MILAKVPIKALESRQLVDHQKLLPLQAPQKTHTHPGLGAEANSPQDSGLVFGAACDGDEFTEGAGGGAILTPPGGGGRRPPPLVLALGLLVASDPSFFCNY